MKKLAIASLIASSMALPALAKPNFIPGWADPHGYDNRGQCQAALAKARNTDRQAEERAYPEDQDLTNKEYNQTTRENWSCRYYEEDDAWYPVHGPSED
jgi:hypothetical protein